MFELSAADYTNGLYFIHIVGLVAGAGGAALGYVLGLALLFLPDRGSLDIFLHRVHVLVSIGLGLLWVTGLALAFLKFPIAALPVKVIMKLVLASVLVVDAFMIGRLLLPMAHTGRSPLVAELSWRDVFNTVFYCSISVASWSAILLLVSFSSLQQLPASSMSLMVVSLWGISVLAIFTVIAGGKLFYSFATPRPRSGFDLYRDTIGLSSTRVSRFAGARPANDEPASAAYRLAEFHRTRSSSFFADAGSQSRVSRTGDTESIISRFTTYVSTLMAAASDRFQNLTSRLSWHRNKDKPTVPTEDPAEKPESDNKPQVKQQQLAPTMTGQLAAVSPQQKKAPKRPSFASAFAQCRTALVGIGGISIVTNILMLTGPLFMLQIYDRVLTSRSIPTLTALIGLVGCLFCFLGVLELIRSRILVRIGLRLDRVLAGNLFESVLRVAPATTALRTRVLQDLEQIRQFISGPGPASLFDIPWTPIYFGLIFVFHWVLGVVALGGAMLLVVFSLLNELLSRRPVAEASQQSSRAMALAEAGWRNAEMLHAMGMFERYKQRWHNEHKEGLATQVKANDLAGTFATLTKVSRLFLQSLILATGAYLAIQQQITPGVIIAASIIMSRGLAPVEQAISNWRGFIAARQGAKRIREAIKELPEDVGRMTLPDAKGHLSIEKLYAGPPGATSPVLKGLNFELQPGDALAVVGANGAGKSTLARVLVGVWPVQHGQVRLDGAALSHWLPEQLGPQVGYLPQDIELLDGTVAENICRFDPDADPGSIVSAACKAQVHDLILRLPDGYATQVGEGGAVLSGGQRQRIALARVLYKNPVLVVLDEPNANLDAEGESALASAIHGLREQGSVVVIMAHRARTIATANLVLVLENGRQIAFDDKEKVLVPKIARDANDTGRSSMVTLVHGCAACFRQLLWCQFSTAHITCLQQPCGAAEVMRDNGLRRRQRARLSSVSSTLARPMLFAQVIGPHG